MNYIISDIDQYYSTFEYPQEFIISIQKQPNADMNGDKYLTVTDLALMVKKVEKTLEYTAEIKDIQIEN